MNQKYTNLQFRHKLHYWWKLLQSVAANIKILDVGTSSSRVVTIHVFNTVLGDRELH